MIIEYNKVRGEVLSPVRANPSDAGLDVFFCPETPSAVEIAPGKNTLLQTGLRFGVPHGYMLQVMNPSGMAAKRSLVVGAHCIDSGYDGEVFIDMHNIGNQQQIITPGTKIAQLVMVPVVPFRAIASGGTGDLYDWAPITISNRGDGGFGSTGE